MIDNFITVNSDISYKQIQGVVLGDRFLSKEEFIQAFKKMLKDTEGYSNLNYNLTQTNKIITTLQKNGTSQSITEFTNNLEQISNIFSSFMMGLGGNISLLTTFFMGQRNQSSYFLMSEKDLPSEINEIGEKTYLNTKKNLDSLLLKSINLEKLNNSLNSHLRGFYRSLTNTKIQNKDEYIKMRVWSYYNMPKRFKTFENNNDHYPVSIGRYFWGKGYIQGYAGEAFGAHLALIHPDALVGQHISNLKNSVISEHGGPGSEDLFSLLASTKGNTSSQLSGDIVVVDKNGNVTFNIQSKASKRGSYDFTITYQQFLQKMMLFKEIYKRNLSNPDNILQKDADALFNAFSTKAWVPIKKETEKNIEKIIDQEILNKIVQKG